MSQSRNLSLSHKITRMNVMVSGIALLIACAAFMLYDAISFRQIMVTNLSSQAQIVGANSVSALLFNDSDSAKQTLAALVDSPGIISATIFRPDGRPFVTYSRNGNLQPSPLPSGLPHAVQSHFFKNGEVVLIRTIFFNGKPVMLVRIRSDLHDVTARFKRYLVIVLLVLLSSFCVAMLMSSAIRRAIAEPLDRLAHTASVVSEERKYSLRAPRTNNGDELDNLIENFNQMLSQIEQNDAALREARDHLDQRVQERTIQLDAANKELEAFSYSVAHDLRAPIRKIAGFARIVVEDYGEQLNDEVRSHLDKVQDGAEQMATLVEGLLSLAKLGRQAISRKTVSLNSMVEEVARGLAGENSGRKIEWRITSLGSVECDYGLVNQVFVNLLSNALKYSRPREISTIEVGQMEIEGEQVFFVRDNGVGFDMKYADKLFGVFQRLHRTEEFEGTGVGLATVERIIRRHGGRIWVDAAPDKGATFFFTLGASPAAPLPKPTPQTAEALA
jgi:signal transduction histidine kinase